MKKISSLFFSILLVLSYSSFANACALYFKSEKLCLEQEWEVRPTKTTAGKMLLTFKDDQGRKLSPKNDPFVLLWMPSMGHGSHPVTLTLIEDGVYKADSVRFVMGGPWDIHYQLKDGKKVIEEVIQKITLR